MNHDEQGYALAGNVKKSVFVLLLLFLGVQYCSSAQTKNDQDMKTVENDEAAIRALMERFAAAFNSGDIDAIMKNYVPDKSFVIFDVVPRKEYRGADTYRKDWADMLSHFKDKPKITITDLGITVDGSVDSVIASNGSQE